MTSVKFTTVPTFKALGPPKPLFPMPSGVLFFDVAKDGQRFLMPVPIQGAGAVPPLYGHDELACDDSEVSGLEATRPRCRELQRHDVRSDPWCYPVFKNVRNVL